MESHNDSIKLLPALLIEKIAAGEVIERPSSVLKELIENAVDAGADKIDVSIEDSGFSLIKVADNGFGITASDLPLSIVRHATSKIRSLDDLFSVRTMGFRGEALASIAAVSRLEILSAVDSSGSGSMLSIQGGEGMEISPSARPRGTTISARDLFFNTPARKKFMKSRKAERMQISSLMEHLAMAYPAVHMVLSIDGKQMFDVPAAADQRDRIGQITGTEFARSLCHCTGSAEGIAVSVFITPPERATPRPRFQCLFVNRRRIDNDSVTYAVRNAFRSFMGGPLNPGFFCFMDVSPDKVDVNVHPTKRVIRFDDEQRLFGIIYGIVDRGLKATLASHNTFLHAGSDTIADNMPAGSVASGPDVVKEPDQFIVQHSNALPDTESAADQMSIFFSGTAQADAKPTVEKRVDVEHDGMVPFTTKPDTHEHWDLISCYQIHDLFILAPIKNGILLIDQHAAHERILYEQALANLASGHAESQQLLFPVPVELTATEKSIVMSNRELFGTFGYEIGDFGGSTVSVSAIPAIIKSSQVTSAVHDMVRYLLDEQSVKHFPEPQRRFAAAFACGGAIKSGQRLTQEEMNALLNNLFASENPYTCPHGRPTLVRISVDELRRRFLR